MAKPLLLTAWLIGGLFSLLLLVVAQFWQVCNVGAVINAAFTPDGQIIQVIRANGHVEVSNSRGLKVSATLEAPFGKGLVALAAVSADGQRIAGTIEGYYVAVLWNAETGRVLHTFPLQTYVTSLALSADGKHLLTGSYDGQVKLWDAETGKQLRVLRFHKGTVLTVGLSGDGNLMFSSGAESRFEVSNIHSSSGQPLSGPPAQGVPTIWSAAFSPDNRMIFGVASDGSGWLWEVSSGNFLHRLPGMSAYRGKAAFSPDGKTVFTGSFTSEMGLFDITTGNLLHRLAEPTWEPRKPNSFLNGVSFSQDGKTLLTGSADGPVWLWNVETGEPMRRLCPLRLHEVWVWVASALAVFALVFPLHFFIRYSDRNTRNQSTPQTQC